MPSIQVADEMFVAAAPAAVASVIADRSRWRRWWPDLDLTVTEDRGEVGLRWAAAGAITGTMEIWCEPSLDGFLLHYYLHGEPTGGVPAGEDLGRWTAEESRIRRIAGKVMSFEVKGLLEGDREVGGPAASAEWLHA